MFKPRDIEAYRRDEKLGHKMLTPEERIRLLKPYLPSPPLHPSEQASKRAMEEQQRLGVRRFLKTHWHLLVFTIIHALFSLYIRIRQAYHQVFNKVSSIYHHHHRAPDLIYNDVKDLRRLPNHLSVILTLDEDARGGTGLAKLIEEASDIAAWCASARIPQLSIYEKTGTLKGYLPRVHRSMTQKLAAYFGPNTPGIGIRAPHCPSMETAPTLAASRSENDGIKHLSVMILSAEDGRDSIVDLTKTLADMSQRGKISTSDITTELVDAELSESVMGEPDLLLLFGPRVELVGYPPWQVRLTEISHVQDNEGVNYQIFYRGLLKYAGAQMRWGR
ncbi:di-trans,poly-cis-decaprenylcistransferase [Neurospora intermedia]|uniref:ditrans,polycis-polyprenyl diphosphate synthase [(2E,6E)-farnesyldiphosphate specific] n=1 Tax=Neurospora intermedia TaxID=5142 RepID=A0ABR3DPJ3_NEUIN